MARSNTVEHQNEDQTKNWLLTSFQAARSGPLSFDFPELDDDLDNSQRTDDSKPSGNVLIDSGFDDLMSKLSTEDVSDTSLDPESPSGRGSRARLLDVLETPLKVSNNDSRKDSPSFSRHIDISQLLKYFAVSPTAPQSPLTKGSSYNVTSDIDGDLTDEDWDYLFRICSFFDDQKTEEITRASSYNTQDGRNAASALGLDAPSGKRLQVLLELGLDLYKYSEEAKPWMVALAAREERAFSRKHHQFLSQRREAILLKAAQIYRENVLSEYFAYFKAAIHDNRRGPQQILHCYELVRLRPIYFRVWRSQIQQYYRLDAESEDLIAQARMRRSLQKLKQSIDRVNQQTAQSETILRVKRCHQILEIWQRKKMSISETLKGCAGNAKIFRSTKYVSLWSNKLRLLRVQRIHSKLVLRRLTAVFQSRREAKKHAIDMGLKRSLLFWKQQTAEVSSNYSKQSHCEMILKNNVKNALFRAWHTKLKGITVSYTIRRIITAKYLKEMRLSMALSQYIGRKKQRLKVQYITHWNREYIGIANLQVYCGQLQFYENLAVKRLTLHLLQREFRQLRIETCGKVVSCRKYVFGKNTLRCLRQSRSRNLSMTALSKTVRSRALSAQFLRALATSSEVMKSIRLANNSADCKRRLDVKNLLSLLRHWRAKAQAAVHLINQVGISSRSCCKKNIFHGWREATVRGILAYDGASNLRSKMLFENALANWKELSGLIESFAELANSYNTSNLASFFKVKLRRWQQQSSSVILSQSQANKLREGRIRSIALSVLQNWQECVNLSGQNSVSFDSNLVPYQTPWGGAQIPLLITPGKRPPMSPNRLQKWKNQNKAFTSSKSHRSDRSRVLPISHTSSLAGERSLVAQRSDAGTPTRPFRAVINSHTTTLPDSLI